jgi:SAM-dependent methyltransferase
MGLSWYADSRERLVPDVVKREPGGYLIYLVHLCAYRWAAPQVRGLRVLDFGCGTGYGTYELCQSAASVVGVDVSAEGVAYAADTFAAQNLNFKVIQPIENEPLPFPDGYFGAVISNQVIEHVPSPSAYVREIERVLEPNGFTIVVTPNRNYRLFAKQRPWNPFHVTEFRADEIEAILLKSFGEVQIFGMWGQEDVVTRELHRTERLRRITLPFTFPGVPEWWRQAGLKAMARLRPPRRSRPTDFADNAIWICDNAVPSLHIVARARKKMQDLSRDPRRGSVRG